MKLVKRGNFWQIIYPGTSLYKGGGGGGGGGCNTPPIIQTLVKVGQNGTDICPKLVKMELIFA